MHFSLAKSNQFQRFAESSFGKTPQGPELKVKNATKCNMCYLLSVHFAFCDRDHCARAMWNLDLCCSRDGISAPRCAADRDPVGHHRLRERLRGTWPAVLSAAQLS